MSMSEDGIEAEVVDATGRRIGDVDGVDLERLAHRLPVVLDDGAREDLDVDQDRVDLPPAWIRSRGEDRLVLNEGLAAIRDLLGDHDHV
jgi:hypothetical protein